MDERPHWVGFGRSSSVRAVVHALVFGCDAQLMQACTTASFTPCCGWIAEPGSKLSPYRKSVTQNDTPFRLHRSPMEEPASRRALAFRLVRVQSGVATRDRERYRPGLRAASWPLFPMREQIDTYVQDDPRRFTDPLPHSQLQSAFARVANGPKVVGEHAAGNELPQEAKWTRERAAYFLFRGRISVGGGCSKSILRWRSRFSSVSSTMRRFALARID